LQNMRGQSILIRNWKASRKNSPIPVQYYSMAIGLVL